MKLDVKKEILEDVITSTVSVAELGDSVRDSSTELEMLHDFVKIVELSQIDFKANIKIENGLPTITDDAVDGTNIVELDFNDMVMNHKYTVDENLKIEFSVNTKKILPTQLNDVLKTPELYGQTMVHVFTEKVKSEITSKLEEIRGLDNGFESETEVIL